MKTLFSSVLLLSLGLLPLCSMAEPPNLIIIHTGEHHKHNKGLPYETSAGIPFILRYPAKVLAGKTIHSAQVNVDFAPTILSLMGVKGPLPGVHGSDTSAEFLSPENVLRSKRIIYVSNANSRWVAGVNDRYKLVISPSDRPWLYNLKRDPFGLDNFYNDPEYKNIKETMTKELDSQMKRFGEPALAKRSLKRQKIPKLGR